MGNPLLLQAGRTLSKEEILSREIETLRQDLYETMKHEGGIGIAAPQLGVSVQVALIQIPEGQSRYPGATPSELMTIINPVIHVLNQELQGFWEGCLSVPGLRGFVERPRHIRVDFLDEEARPKSLELEGFIATVFQHELDHLFGKLYIHRITDLNKLVFIEEYQAYWAPLLKGSDE
jgi:peptide deformylase